MNNWKVIITTRCLNTNITQDEITLEVLTTDSTAARRVAMQRLYRDKHIAELDAEIAQLRAKVARLQDRDLKLSALEAAGVDNWNGWDDAMDYYWEWKEEGEKLTKETLTNTSLTQSNIK